MKIRMATAVAVAILASVPLGLVAQQKRGASTPQERAAVVELAKKLQEAPLDPNLQTERERLVMVLVEAPDLSAMPTCADEMPWVKGKYKYASELMMIHLISTAAYTISHQNADEKMAHLAGLEGVVKAYQAMVKQDGKAKWQPMEGLVTRFNNGELAKAAPEFCKRQ